MNEEFGMNIQAYAAHEPNGKLESFGYELGDLKPDEVELDVEYCGICHSDLSMLKNEWAFTRYPFVPGQEIIGKVAAIGSKLGFLILERRILSFKVHESKSLLLTFI